MSYSRTHVKKLIREGEKEAGQRQLGENPNPKSSYKTLKKIERTKKNTNFYYKNLRSLLSILLLLDHYCPQT